MASVSSSLQSDRHFDSGSPGKEAQRPLSTAPHPRPPPQSVVPLMHPGLPSRPSALPYHQPTLSSLRRDLVPSVAPFPGRSEKLCKRLTLKLRISRPGVVSRLQMPGSQLTAHALDHHACRLIWVWTPRCRTVPSAPCACLSPLPGVKGTGPTC